MSERVPMKEKLHNFNIKIKPQQKQRIRNLTELQTNILVNRTNNDPLPYVIPRLNLEEDLYKLKDVDKAGELIAKHIKENNFIALVTDYDADK